MHYAHRCERGKISVKYSRDEKISKVTGGFLLLCLCVCELQWTSDVVNRCCRSLNTSSLYTADYVVINDLENDADDLGCCTVGHLRRLSSR